MCIICNLGTEPTRAQTVALKLESVQRGRVRFLSEPPPPVPKSQAVDQGYQLSALSGARCRSAPTPALPRLKVLLL